MTDNEYQIGNVRFSTSELIRVAVWVVTIMLAYGALSERISVLETKYDNLSYQLQKIDDKLDRILNRQGGL